MNGINRVGQKVVCVAELEIVDANGIVSTTGFPKIDQVYTVAGFLEAGREHGTAVTTPGVELAEVGCLKIRMIGGTEWTPLGWPIPMFRPADERKTDISDMLALCLGNTVRETEPA